ncbi:MAG: hypothetical protein NTW75_11705 [Planctomycetales bacterium]|nr:hypothetical protein [Planctomycetales bacterium]
MAMGHWRTEQQQEFWIATDELSQTPRHVCYQRVNEWLAKAEFASWLEQLCRPHDSQQDHGSIAPGEGFSDAAGRLFRGHRLTTRDRVAVFRQFVADEFPELSATRGDCRAFESDLDHVAVAAGD